MPGRRLIFAALVACASPVEPGDAGVADAGAGDAGTPNRYRTFITSDAELEDLLQDATGYLKYLGPVRGRPVTPPITAMHFQDTDEYPDHLSFLRSFDETSTLSPTRYVELVIRPSTRRWWGGGIGKLGQPNPDTGAANALGYFIYSESVLHSTLSLDDIAEVDAALKMNIPYAADRIAFMPTDSRQEQQARSAASELRARGVSLILP